MRKPTIYEIKRATLETAPYFFHRKTLKHFGQAMKSFTVEKSPKGNIYIYAPIFDRDGKFMKHFTFRKFEGNKLTHCHYVTHPSITIDQD